MDSLIISQPLDEEQLRREVTPEEWAAARKMGSQRRREEWLTWRALLRREAGADLGIGYNAQGAPQTDREGLYISVSHCREGVAVRLADRRCAIDMESLQRNFERVAPRYITPLEERFAHVEHYRALIWSAKETLYKYAGRQGADFLTELTIGEIDPRSCTIIGCIAPHERVTMHYICFSDSVLVYTR